MVRDLISDGSHDSGLRITVSGFESSTKPVIINRIIGASRARQPNRLLASRHRGVERISESMTA